MHQKPGAPCPQLGRHLGEPDRCLRRLYLAEERTDGTELVVTPVLEQPRRLWRDVPHGLWQLSPLVYLSAKLIDDGCRIILLGCCGDPEPFVEDQRLLCHTTLLLLGLRD